MTLWSKIIRAGDERRKTRLHTPNGVLCLNIIDLFVALFSTALRIVTCGSLLMPIPWIALPAVRFIGKHLEGKVIFEYGSGMSTIWYTKRAKAVYAVEDDLFWHKKIASALYSCKNTSIIFANSKQDYICAIDKPDVESFDIIQIDGSFRESCFEYAQKN